MSCDFCSTVVGEVYSVNGTMLCDECCTVIPLTDVLVIYKGRWGMWHRVSFVDLLPCPCGLKLSFFRAYCTSGGEFVDLSVSIPDYQLVEVIDE